MNECIAFEGNRRIALGDLRDAARKAKHVIDRGERGPVLLFDALTSHPIEVDFRGTVEDVVNRLKKEPQEGKEIQRKGPGRPMLGVVGREVTLLPRHWEWLNSQPGGASVALRRLVEQARKSNSEKDRKREAQESAYRFISAIAGNAPGYEEALRALYAGKTKDFDQCVKTWPRDVQEHARKLALRALE